MRPSNEPLFWAIFSAGGMILAGQILWAWNLWKTARTPKPYDYRADLVDTARETAHGGA